MGSREDGLDHELVLKIQDLLNGKEWDTDTLDNIAALLVAYGYEVRDPGDAL